MTLRPLFQILGLVLLLALPASWAKEAVPASDDPALEARVLEIAEQLRCLVCQNETIAASRADLATDLRNQIRIKLKANQSRQEILDFMVARYGDFVLYKPPLRTSTILLWAGPFMLLVLASVVLARTVRRRREEQRSERWTPEQEARARALLDETGGPR